MKIICSRPSLLCCTCFFPIYYNLQVIYSPLGSTEDADEAISVFAILQQYLDQLSICRFNTDKAVSILMHIHQKMHYTYQFQIIDRDIPLHVVHKTLSILDIEQAVPILSTWTTKPHLINNPQMISVIITLSGYVYLCPYEERKGRKNDKTHQHKIAETDEKYPNENGSIFEEHHTNSKKSTEEIQLWKTTRRTANSQ